MNKKLFFIILISLSNIGFASGWNDSTLNTINEAANESLVSTGELISSEEDLNCHDPNYEEKNNWYWDDDEKECVIKKARKNMKE